MSTFLIALGYIFLYIFLGMVTYFPFEYLWNSTHPHWVDQIVDRTEIILCWVPFWPIPVLLGGSLLLCYWLAKRIGAILIAIIASMIGITTKEKKDD